MAEGCPHLGKIESIKRPKRRVCEDCERTGGEWVQLRTCQQCGGTRCCDSSPSRHATAHARSSGHPVIASAEPKERWLYCYADEVTVEY